MKSNKKIRVPQEYMGRDVGQLAEDTLRMWVSRDTSLTLNPVENDKEGWDCLLEFPPESPEEGKPWDTVPPRIECFIQVKGTESSTRKRNVKLSNWQKLISKQQPAFFLVYEFGVQDLDNAYLVHVHEKWMEKVLKRLRQERHGESRPLHKQFITLTWSDEERVEPLNGAGLIRSILKHVGDDFDDYVQKKRKMRKELGLDTPFLLHFTSLQYGTDDEMYREVVDFALGLRSKLPLSKAIVEKDVRFGIPAEIIDKGEGELFVSPDGTEVTLTFQNSSGLRKATFLGTVYSPNYLFPGQELPSQYKKYRLVYPLGEIVFLAAESSGSGMASLETKFHIEISQEPIEMREISNTWRVITMLLNASSDGLELLISRAGYPPIKVDVQSISVPEPYQVIAEAVENAWFLVRQLEILDVKVLVDDIFRQRESLALTKILLDANQPPIRAITLKSPKVDKPDRDHAIVVSRTIVFGDYRVFIAAGMAGPLHSLDDGAEFEIPRPARVHVEYFFLPRDGGIKDAMLSMYDKLRKKGYEVIEFEEYLSEKKG